MGTRSITIVRNGLEKTSPKIVTMYKQMDGYPDGMGLDLAEFLCSIKMVNGISLAENEVIANGTGCLAAQIVAHFKDGAGSIYLEPHSNKKGAYGEEYIYEVFADTFNTKEGIRLSCYDVYGKKEIFSGSPAQFMAEFGKVNK